MRKIKLLKKKSIKLVVRNLFKFKAKIFKEI